MAAPIVMPFVMGMLLGRSIDLTTYNVGGEVFDDRVYNETKVNQFISTYTVLQDNQFPYTFAGLPVDLVMKNKAGYISSSSGAMGLDGLLKETSWKQRSAVIAVQSAVQTVRRTLKKDAEPLANWTSRVPDSQTHYAHSVVYGGWAFVLYRFACEIPGDAKIVRKTLTDTLGAFGELGPETAELWQKAQEAIKSNPEIRGKVTIIIKTYATFPFKQDFRTPQRLLDAVSEVPKLVGPVGKPMIMELLPLHDLDAKYPVVEEHHDSDTKLENLVEMFDDVKNTKKSIHRWISRLDADLTEDQEYKIAELLLHLNIFIKLFHEIASEASIYKDVNQNNLINAAATVYEQRIELFTYSYDRIFRRLKEDIDPECGNSFYPKVRGLLKVHKREQLEPIKMMEGDVKHCKTACLEEPRCRAIAFVEKLVTKKLTETNPRVWKVKTERNLCIVYFRSSSTADVVEIPENSVADVYDRTCQWVASP